MYEDSESAKQNTENTPEHTAEKAWKKPAVGQGLNKEAELLLQGILPKKGMSVSKWSKRIKRRTERMQVRGGAVQMGGLLSWLVSLPHADDCQAKFVSYKAETGDWRFCVPHF